MRNAGQAQIDGVEMDLTMQATDQFGISAGIAYLNSELKDDFCNFINTDGKPQQSPCINADGDVLPPQAPQGTKLPVTPEWKANATARYEFNVASFDSYVQGSVIYTSEREADLRTLVTPTDFGIIDPLPVREVLGQMPSYTVADLSAGFGKDGWRLELFVQNAFDESARGQAICPVPGRSLQRADLRRRRSVRARTASSSRRSSSRLTREGAREQGRVGSDPPFFSAQSRKVKRAPQVRGGSMNALA